MKIFEQLGVYGVSVAKENALLASFLTGDPALLIGKPGTAKTALANMIGACMDERNKKLGKPRFRYQIYDSSKLNFEDLVGIPNPKSLTDGKVDFIETPMTAWNKRLIVFDEFNRQEPSRQNNIFELIRSRTLMGIPTNTIWVINCMNPYGLAGTETLDDAIIDRHSFFIHIDDFKSLDLYYRDKIVSHVGSDDAIALNVWKTNINREFDISRDNNINESLAEAGIELCELMQKAAQYYSTLLGSVGDSYRNFVNKFTAVLTSNMESKEWAVDISGRRAGMMHRCLLSYRAIELAKADIYSDININDLRTSFKHVVSMCIPVGITELIDPTVAQQACIDIESVVDTFGSFFESIDESSDSAVSQTDIVFELLTTTDIHRKIEILTTEIDNDFAKSQIWTEILNIKEKENENKINKKNILIALLSHLITINPDIIPGNIRNIIAKRALNSYTLVNQLVISLVNKQVLYKSEIEKLINQYHDIFIRAQAVCSVQEFLSEYKYNIKRSDLEEMIQKTEKTCSKLETLIKKIVKNEV